MRIKKSLVENVNLLEDDDEEIGPNDQVISSEPVEDREPEYDRPVAKKAPVDPDEAEEEAEMNDQAAELQKKNAVAGDAHTKNTYWADEYRDFMKGKCQEIKAGSLKAALQWMYEVNKSNKEECEEDSSIKFQPQNLLILGQPGTGKSAIIEDWIENHRPQLAWVKTTGGNLRDSTVNGLPFKTQYKKYMGKDEDGNPIYETHEKQSYLPSTAFDGLDPTDDLGVPQDIDSVLFIDEINRSMPQAESAILTLVQSHQIEDKNYKKSGSIRTFNKFLFTVAAANPAGGEDEEAVRRLSLALKTRFAVYFQESSIKETGEYLLGKYAKSEAANQRLVKKGKRPAEHGAAKSKNYKGKMNILKALIDADVKYADAAKGHAIANNADGTTEVFGVLNARTLEDALAQCDGTVGDEIGNDAHGRLFTPGSFLDAYAKNCGQDGIDDIIDILDPVKDAEDAATAYMKTCADVYMRFKQKYLRNHR